MFAQPPPVAVDPSSFVGAPREPPAAPPPPPTRGELPPYAHGVKHGRVPLARAGCCACDAVAPRFAPVWTVCPACAAYVSTTVVATPTACRVLVCPLFLVPVLGWVLYAMCIEDTILLTACYTVEHSCPCCRAVLHTMASC